LVQLYRRRAATSGANTRGLGRGEGAGEGGGRERDREWAGLGRAKERHRVEVRSPGASTIAADAIRLALHDRARALEEIISGSQTGRWMRAHGTKFVWRFS
jgi:hypothetical protein